MSSMRSQLKARIVGQIMCGQISIDEAAARYNISRATVFRLLSAARARMSRFDEDAQGNSAALASNADLGSALSDSYGSGSVSDTDQDNAHGQPHGQAVSEGDDRAVQGSEHSFADSADQAAHEQAADYGQGSRMSHDSDGQHHGEGQDHGQTQGADGSGSVPDNGAGLVSADGADSGDGAEARPGADKAGAGSGGMPDGAVITLIKGQEMISFNNGPRVSLVKFISMASLAAHYDWSDEHTAKTAARLNCSAAQMRAAWEAIESEGVVSSGRYQRQRHQLFETASALEISDGDLEYANNHIELLKKTIEVLKEKFGICESESMRISEGTRLRIIATIQHFHRSGLSITRICELMGLNVRSYYRWLKSATEEDSAASLSRASQNATAMASGSQGRGIDDAAAADGTAPSEQDLQGSASCDSSYEPAIRPARIRRLTTEVSSTVLELLNSQEFAESSLLSTYRTLREDGRINISQRSFYNIVHRLKKQGLWTPRQDQSPSAAAGRHRGSATARKSGSGTAMNKGSQAQAPQGSPAAPESAPASDPHEPVEAAEQTAHSAPDQDSSQAHDHGQGKERNQACDHDQSQGHNQQQEQHGHESPAYVRNSAESAEHEMNSTSQDISGAGAAPEATAAGADSAAGFESALGSSVQSGQSSGQGKDHDPVQDSQPDHSGQSSAAGNHTSYPDEARAASAAHHSDSKDSEPAPSADKTAAAAAADQAAALAAQFISDQHNTQGADQDLTAHNAPADDNLDNEDFPAMEPFSLDDL
ncbi:MULTISPECIES: hypothetical protein [unclassified Anaerobiospirillum]|uniref:helix-turn-helix domain-containing protein n=1 Tax=unclassified Anaerobiospirillum TaxID=2647410 RepID=UPI001FF29AE3|nr:MULTISPECIES: hypothetical protein [unclassified Anaerobiospirillum]MCK0534713.1 hypothetical protein [Anaerobiospirillum sp. NML120511]MCK0539977.1 hypothetical protein [Anaerobiospirillum sp. NML02-A-032]